MNRAGLEPATYGLTCRTGFHQPYLTSISFHRLLSIVPVAVWTLPSPCEQGATRQVSEEPLVNSFRTSLRFPADCPIRRIVTLSRTDGSQGVPAYGAVLPPAFRPGHSNLKSVALPTELPIHWCSSRETRTRSGTIHRKLRFSRPDARLHRFPREFEFNRPEKRGISTPPKKTPVNRPTVSHRRSQKSRGALGIFS